MSDAAEQKDSPDLDFGSAQFRYEWSVISAQIIEATKKDEGVTLTARQVKVLGLVLGKVSVLLLQAVIKKWGGL